MKNKSIQLPHLATVFFFLTLALAIVSWITSIYGNEGVESMLSPEGIRWLLRHIIPNYLHTPALGIVCTLFFGLGLAHHAGMLQAYKDWICKPQRLTRKQRHTLYTVSACFIAYALLLVSITIGPFTLLQSATGTLAHSPFVDGFVFLFTLGITLCAILYGYSTQRFHSDKDIINGMSSLYIRYSTYFITLFSIVLFFSSFSYTQLIQIMDIDTDVIHYLFQICCYLPFLERK